jgi:hypothetical protein
MGFTVCQASRLAAGHHAGLAGLADNLANPAREQAHPRVARLLTSGVARTLSAATADAAVDAHEPSGAIGAGGPQTATRIARSDTEGQRRASSADVAHQ